jgi:hypothetical protein
MSEGRRIDAGWIALGVLVLSGGALFALRYRHERLMREYGSALAQIVTAVEQEGYRPTDGPGLAVNGGLETDRLPFFGETRHAWTIAPSHVLGLAVDVVCAHAPLSPGAPRILLVDRGGTAENARCVGRLEAKLREAGWSYSVSHNETGGR